MKLNLNQRIEALAKWGSKLDDLSTMEQSFVMAERQNPWFTRSNLSLALEAIRDDFLQKEKLESWLADQPEPAKPLSIGIVMAGNIPLVGFHDLLAVLAAGHKAQVKLSQKDEQLPKGLLALLSEVSPELASRVNVVDKLSDFDAIIATGSNNSARYFDYYFSRYPNLIRKNRTSAAVIEGTETDEELRAMAKDVFQFFGLGCRSISKLFLPSGYDPTIILENWEEFSEIGNHNKYRNNYDYNRSLLLMNGTPHLANNFLMLVEQEELVSPIATIYYEFYKDEEGLQNRLIDESAKLQCVVGKGSNYIDPGQAQRPGLDEYADGVNILEFLAGLN